MAKGMAKAPYNQRKIGMAVRQTSKAKKTFTLSPQAVSYLAETHRATHKPTSQIIEELILERKLQAEQERLSAAITSYYDSMSKEQVEEDRAWGQFAESEMEE
jgi:hypothetical protein